MKFDKMIKDEDHRVSKLEIFDRRIIMDVNAFNFDAMKQAVGVDPFADNTKNMVLMTVSTN